LKQVYELVVAAAVILVAGCTHPIEIVGQGDIRSASGEHDCLVEEAPCKAVAVDRYTETYSAQPRPGYSFAGWDNCPEEQGDSCLIDVAAEVVHDNWGKTAPPLVARFAPDCEAAPPSSFAAIQTVIFNGRGCSSGGCHGAGRPQAGLSLATGSSYGNIVNVTAQGGAGLKLVLPGNADSSYLYRKVAARTRPGSYPISGSPMPLAGSPLTGNELAALALWIDAGAPQTGRVGELNEVEQLLGLCGG
jgi:hypothetical protein